MQEMRVVAGFYKGRKLKSSDDLSIRPATDRVKEYIFNILRDFPKDQSAMDIFAGSGGLGIEALSRGASHIFFVEKAKSSILILKKNLEHIGVPSDSYRILQQDALDFVKRTKIKADLCFMDPPYNYPPLQELVDTFFKNDLLNPDGILVLEHEISNPLAEQSEVYNIFSQKKISRSLISFIEKKV